jgi:predicted DNA-binding transcriptional regulator YafY
MSYEDQTARIERLVVLISLTNTGTAEELARKLGVSRRTVFNDLDFLKGRGCQIVFHHSASSYHFEVKQGKPLLF